MSPHFNRVTIIGVGLLGASLGLAMKARGLAGHITGVGHRQSSLDQAIAVGAVDGVSMDAATATTGADLIVLATPSALVIPKLDEIRPACSPTAVVTDVASTKRAICAHAGGLWQAPRQFVGSHPMAGSEKFGPEHGRANFYEGSVCLVEQGEGLDPAARQSVVDLWEAVGAEVTGVDPTAHDALLAHTSHIPHVLSAAIASRAGQCGDVRKLIGNGFRDVTRIAASRPEVWRDICLTNKDAILDGLTDLRELLDSFHACLSKEDAEALEQFFCEGKEARDRIVDS